MLLGQRSGRAEQLEPGGVELEDRTAAGLWSWGLLEPTARRAAAGCGGPIDSEGKVWRFMLRNVETESVQFVVFWALVFPDRFEQKLIKMA